MFACTASRPGHSCLTGEIQIENENVGGSVRTVPIAVWRLMVAYALMMSGMSLMVLIAGIIGVRFAPFESLATLPIACVIVGVAAATLPTGRLLQRWGRRRVFMAYGGLAVTSALFAAWSLVSWSFPAFCLAAFLLGWSAAAGHQYRFAALEAVPAELAPKATSVLLIGGILAALIGPEMAVRGRDLVETQYAGSYLLLALAYGAGIVLVSRNRDSVVEEHDSALRGRPLGSVMRSPIVLLAVCAAALAYGVMSFLMTATPISMHQHAGHSLEATKWVIQSHIIAMYLPSLAFAWVFARLGFRRMLLAGVLIYSASIAVALSGNGQLHYWLSLVLLGLGWNFLFLTATNLLPYGYDRAERFRVQSANDFLVFSVQAVVALSSGWFLYHWQWQGLLVSVIPPVLAFAWLAWRSRAYADLSQGGTPGALRLRAGHGPD